MNLLFIDNVKISFYSDLDHVRPFNYVLYAGTLVNKSNYAQIIFSTQAFWCLFLDPHPTTCHSNMGVLLKENTKICTLTSYIYEFR